VGAWLGDATKHTSLAADLLFARWRPVLQWYDANVSLPGCDKNMPGSIIAMARLNRPSIMVYGGTIKPGHSTMDGGVLDIVSAFQSYGENGPPAFGTQQHTEQQLRQRQRSPSSSEGRRPLAGTACMSHCLAASLAQLHSSL
jgi:dihydroxyacid dehydratase/phosphogluconate dehydratase